MTSAIERHSLTVRAGPLFEGNPTSLTTTYVFNPNTRTVLWDLDESRLRSGATMCQVNIIDLADYTVKQFGSMNAKQRNIHTASHLPPKRSAQV